MTRAWPLILGLLGASALRADAPLLPAPLPDLAPAALAPAPLPDLASAPAPLPVLTPALTAASPAVTTVETPGNDGGASRWESVLLFDWLYSGEKPYQVLKQAAELAGDQGWIAKRLEQDQKVPQASARELAYKLASNQSLDPALRAQLKDLFADETQQLGASAQQAVADKATQVDSTLVDASKKLDALEASLAKNTYGKGSSTGVTLNIYTGYRLDDPSGMVQGEERAYPVGGMDVLMAGTLGKVNYNFTLGAEYLYNNLYQSGSGVGVVQTAETDQRSDGGNLDAGASFQVPLGRHGGLDVSLGTIENVELSPLLFASIEPINRDAFFVDVTAAYRAPKIIKTMELNYPAATFNFRGLYVVKEGSDWYWPFDSTQFVYTPNDMDYYFPWDAHLYTWALRLDENLKPHGDWFDGGLVYGMVSGVSNALDQAYGSGQLGTPIPITANIFNLGPGASPQSVQSYGLGSELRFSSGTIVHLDAAASSYSWTWPSEPQDYNGTAVIATVAQPMGPFNVALEAGQASPYFLSAPRVENRIQNGATQDSIADVYNPTAANNHSGAIDGSEDLSGQKTAPAVSWISMMNQPDVLTNNNNQLALKGEWHGSWISVGAYDGAQMQINPTEAYVWTTPYIEGNQDDGYGWFRMFGNTFSNDPPDTSPSGQAGGTLQQILFNAPTQGHALDPAGQSMNVYWQQMAQHGNYETEFITLLSQKGVGDNNVMANSAKSLNYAGTNLLFDFGALMDRSLPLQVTVIGEDRDMNTMPGIAGVGGDDLFNQQFEVADLNWGISDTLTFLGTAGFETWKTEQSYYPVNMQITEFGVGADLNEDPLVTGLVFNLRASVMNFEDLNIASRDLSLITLSVGSTLSY